MLTVILWCTIIMQADRCCAHGKTYIHKHAHARTHIHAHAHTLSLQR